MDNKLLLEAIEAQFDRIGELKEQINQVYKLVCENTEQIKGLKHDMDIVFTCNEEQGKKIKNLDTVCNGLLDVFDLLNNQVEDIDGRLESTEDIVMSLANDEDEEISVEDVMKDAPKNPTEMFDKLFSFVAEEPKQEEPKPLTNDEFWSLVDRWIKEHYLTEVTTSIKGKILPSKDKLMEILKGQEHKYTIFNKIMLAAESWEDVPKICETFLMLLKSLGDEPVRHAMLNYNGYMVDITNNIVTIKKIK